MSTDVITNNDAVQPPVFELRVYHAQPGKLGELIDRFRDHTTRLFKKHGMKVREFWLPNEAPLKDQELIYILEHSSNESAAQSWKDLITDPEWVEVAARSEANGKLVASIDSTFMNKLDLSTPTP